MILVNRTTTVQRERTILLAHVLLSENHTCTYRNLSPDDTVVIELVEDTGWKSLSIDLQR